MRVRIQHCTKPLLIGDRIAFRASIRRITNFGNPGEFDWAGWNLRRDIVASAFVWSDRDVVVLAEADDLNAITELRRQMSQRARVRGDRGAALVAALTVGDRGALDGRTLENIRDAGMAHALAISGLHVGLLAAACLLLMRHLLLWTRYVLDGRDATRAACLAAFAAVSGYALLGGAGVSVMRAVTMGAAGLVVLALSGTGRPLDVLGVSAAGLALAIPGVAREPGFQLSFIATLGLLVLAREVRRSRATGVVAWAGVYLSVPVLAWLVTTPVVAEHFQRISLAAPAVNVVAGPLVSAVVLLGLLGTVLLPVSVTAAEIPLVLAGWCAEWLLMLCDWVATIPWAAIDVISPGPVLTAALTSLPLVVLMTWRSRAYPTVCLLAVTTLLIGYTAAERYRDDRLEVHFASVGQGDATIVKLPGGEIAVIDGGRPGRGRLAVGPWLGRLAVRRIDYLVATHVQADHWGGLGYLVDHFEIGQFWYNGGVCLSEGFEGFLANLDRRGIPVVNVGVELAGPDGRLVRSFGPLSQLEALAPREAEGACDANDRSVVLSVRYGAHSVLLTGDIEAGGERTLLQHPGLAAHGVLKAPHHGSRTSSTQRLLDRVGPWLAIAGCGAGNRYGFPHLEVIDRYREAGVVFLSTARHGAVSLVVDGRGVRVNTAKKL